MHARPVPFRQGCPHADALERTRPTGAGPSSLPAPCGEAREGQAQARHHVRPGSFTHLDNRASQPWRRRNTSYTAARPSARVKDPTLTSARSLARSVGPTGIHGNSMSREGTPIVDPRVAVRNRSGERALHLPAGPGGERVIHPHGGRASHPPLVPGMFPPPWISVHGRARREYGNPRPLPTRRRCGPQAHTCSRAEGARHGETVPEAPPWVGSRMAPPSRTGRQAPA